MKHILYRPHGTSYVMLLLYSLRSKHKCITNVGDAALKWSTIGLAVAFTLSERIRYRRRLDLTKPVGSHRQLANCNSVTYMIPLDRVVNSRCFDPCIVRVHQITRSHLIELVSSGVLTHVSSVFSTRMILILGGELTNWRKFIAPTLGDP